jgi:predicted RNA polymerase sigma factor
MISRSVVGDLLRRTGRIDEARAAYAKAIALDPPSARRPQVIITVLLPASRICQPMA